MICEFCRGSGQQRFNDQRGDEYDDCLYCHGSGFATCDNCGTTKDVVCHPNGPEYVCTDCLFEELEYECC